MRFCLRNRNFLLIWAWLSTHKVLKVCLLLQQVSLKAEHFPIKICPNIQVYVSESVFSITRTHHIVLPLLMNFTNPHLHMHNILIYYLWYGITTVNFALSPVQIKTLKPQQRVCCIYRLFSMCVFWIVSVQPISCTCTIFCTTGTLYSAHYGMSASKQFSLFPIASKYVPRTI